VIVLIDGEGTGEVLLRLLEFPQRASDRFSEFRKALRPDNEQCHSGDQEQFEWADVEHDVLSSD
jgi:hypothetical protein